MIELAMMTYLIVKHFICDFPIHVQTPWMFRNKGIYGHPGGIVHALIHCLATLPLSIFMVTLGGVFELPTLLGVFFFEYIVHYHMDWFKMWYGDRRCWDVYVPQFWTFLGVDQMVHYLTYIVIVAWLCT